MRTRIQRYLVIITDHRQTPFCCFSCMSTTATSPPSSAFLQTTLTSSNLRSCGRDPSQRNGLTVCQVVQRRLRDVEACRRVIDSQHVDGPAVVAELPASAALHMLTSACMRPEKGGRGYSYVRAVPAWNHIGTANIGEVRSLTLNRPAKAGLETVGAVRAGD